MTCSHVATMMAHPNSTALRVRGWHMQSFAPQTVQYYCTVYQTLVDKSCKVYTGTVPLDQ